MADGGRRRVAHVVARAGWSIGALTGGVLLTVLYILDKGGKHIEELLVGGLVVMFPAGGVFGAWIGWLAQSAARGILRSAGEWPPAESRWGAPPVPAVSPYDGMVGVYRACYRRCEAAVTRFHAIAELVPVGPAKDWLLAMAADLDAELVEAGRLARLGSALASGGHDETAVAEQLKAAAASFDATAARAGEIALTLAEGPEFDRVRAQLDMLASQAPTLRTAPDS